MILYTSDIKTDKSAFKTAFTDLLLSIFVALLGAVYELFSHEVYSYYMIYAFAIPLVGGTLPFLAIGLFKPSLYPKAIPRNLYGSGIATLTVGSIVQGILEIYGTTNSLVRLYQAAGILLVVAGIVLWLIEMVIRKS